jgi:hypothetical protein
MLLQNFKKGWPKYKVSVLFFETNEWAFSYCFTVIQRKMLG